MRNHAMAQTSDLDLMFEPRETDPGKPIDDRYVKNAAFIPDLPPRREIIRTEERTPGGDLRIHGFTAPDYQQVYHTVVDPLLTPDGKLTPYSLELGLTIKEQLFQELAYPCLQTSHGSDGKVEVTESFCLLRPTPHFNLDCKGEPY